MIEEVQNYKSMIDYFTLLLGWFLELLSTLLVSFSSRIFKKREILRGIRIELNSIKLRLAGICSNSIVEHGEVTKEWTDWIKPYYEILGDSSDFKYLKDKPKKEISITKMSNEQFYNFLKMWNIDSRTSNELKTPNYSIITLPFLEANYNYLSLLSKNYQMKIALLQR